MDKIYEQAMLFDFYGELLTEHQRSVYADAVYRDLSLREIAEERGISRQGVHDMIRRCDRILQEYESKLHLVERFARAKKVVEEIGRLTEDMAGMGEERAVPAEIGGPVREDAIKMHEKLLVIRRLARELLKEL